MLFERLILSDLSCHPMQVIIGCSVTLPSAVYILHPPHTHTSVTHGDVSDLYGHSSRRHLDFFPSQSLKCKHPSCLDLPNEHLVFQSGLLAATLFFLVPVWGGRQGCSALWRHTHEHACTHTPRSSLQHMY